MKGARWFGSLFALVTAIGCGDDDEGRAPTVGDASVSQGETTTPGTTTGAATDDTTSEGETSTANPGDTTGSGSTSDSGDDGPSCDPVVPGEWNACLDANGTVSNGQCNWMGTGSSTGFVGCLTSSQTEGANVCMITGCRDVCDCFAPPSTGTAEVICDTVLADGGTACALSCAAGQTCPDGMTCEADLCFWPPR